MIFKALAHATYTHNMGCISPLTWSFLFCFCLFSLWLLWFCLYFPFVSPGVDFLAHSHLTKYDRLYFLDGFPLYTFSLISCSFLGLSSFVSMVKMNILKCFSHFHVYLPSHPIRVSDFLVVSHHSTTESGFFTTTYHPYPGY